MQEKMCVETATWVVADDEVVLAVDYSVIIGKYSINVSSRLYGPSDDKSGFQITRSSIRVHFLLENSFPGNLDSIASNNNN